MIVDKPKPYRRWLLACLLSGFLAALIAGSVVLIQLNLPNPELFDRPSDMVLLFTFSMFAITGVLIIVYHPRNAIGWLFYVIGTSGVFSGFGTHYGIYTLRTNPGALPAGLLIALLSHTAWLLFVVPVFTLLPLLFPTGRPLSPRWAWLGWLTVAGLAVTWLSETFRPRLAFGEDSENLVIKNPVGIPGGELWIDRINNASLSLLMAVALLSVVSLVIRYRRGHVQERAQIRWFALSAALNFAMLFAGEYFGLDSDLSFALVITIMPIAVAVAIFKYRLYDIDILIRRTLVYSILTGLLALIYFGTVIVLQRFFTTQTGEESPLAIVASTLLIAALFTPLRRRIQEVIDLRFFRRKYDAEKVLANFADAVRQETDPDRLTAELLRAVNETVQPEHVSLWLRSPGPDGRQLGTKEAQWTGRA